MEQPAVARQVRMLRQLGLVDSQRYRRSSIAYTPYDDQVAQLLDEAVHHAEHLRLSTPDRPDGRARP